MKIFNNIYLSLITFFICTLIFVISLYNFELASVNNDKSTKEITIEQGSIKSIAEKLYNEKIKE